ncbi:hypothetical protein ONZ45_g5121 [Pleurotus djamor]|nr:hypothetical protein ONZ45_g5121 [Pleurotus djamor]
MAFVNPLHPTVVKGQQSSFSSIGNAVPRDFISPKRRRIYQTPFKASGKWNAALGSPNSGNTIHFDVLGHPGQGISMQELYSRGVSGLSKSMEQEAIDLPLGKEYITFRIHWPGYEDWVRSVGIKTALGRVTVAQLGGLIARQYFLFFEMNMYKTPTGPRKKSDDILGQNGVNFDRLILVSLTNVHEDSWQADIAVDMP